MCCVMLLAARVRALTPDVWPEGRLRQERAAIVRDLEELALTFEPRAGRRKEAVIHVINGRRVTVQHVRQPFTISVGKDP